MAQKEKLVWFVLARVAVVSVFLFSAIFFNFKAPEILGDAAYSGLIKLIIATYLFSIGSLFILKVTDRFRRSLTYAQIVWDLILVTLLLLLTGGISSPYSFLYIL